MKESYKEGDAHHFDPESCLDDPRGRREALTGESTGGLWSFEITSSREPIQWAGEKATSTAALLRVAVGPGGVKEPGMCGHSSHENRESLGCVR